MDHGSHDALSHGMFYVTYTAGLLLTWLNWSLVKAIPTMPPQAAALDLVVLPLGAALWVGIAAAWAHRNPRLVARFRGWWQARRARRARDTFHHAWDQYWRTITRIFAVACLALLFIASIAAAIVVEDALRILVDNGAWPAAYGADLAQGAAWGLAVLAIGAPYLPLLRELAFRPVAVLPPVEAKGGPRSSE